MGLTSTFICFSGRQGRSLSVLESSISEPLFASIPFAIANYVFPDKWSRLSAHVRADPRLGITLGVHPHMITESQVTSLFDRLAGLLDQYPGWGWPGPDYGLPSVLLWTCWLPLLGERSTFSGVLPCPTVILAFHLWQLETLERCVLWAPWIIASDCCSRRTLCIWQTTPGALMKSLGRQLGHWI